MLRKRWPPRGASTPTFNMHALRMIWCLDDAERRSDWLVKAVNRRLREEFVARRSDQRDKSRMVDLKKGRAYFPGF